MKKIIIAFLAVIVLFSFLSCIHKDSSIKEYGQFRNKKYIMKSNLEIFPTELDDKWNVEDYIFRYSESFFFEDSYIYLNITFEQEEYEKEVERICQVKNTYYNGNEIIEDNEHFQYTAYVLTYGYVTTEYVLVIPDEYRIVYIYINDVHVSNISIPQKYLPKDYEDYGPSSTEYVA